MMKNRTVHIALSTFLMLAMLVSLCACGGPSDSLKGTWAGTNDDEVGVTWTFDGGGKCKMENDYGTKDDGTYTIDGDKVSIKLNGWDAEKLYQFTISGSSLSLSATDAMSPNYELKKG